MSTTPKMIILKSCDGETFEVEEAVAVQSQTIKHMIEVGCAGSTIPVPNVTGETLARVIEYCLKHADADKDKEKVPTSSPDESLKAWDADFVDVDQKTLFDIMLAANYLYIKGLLDLTCQTVADMIKGRTPEEIREKFHINNDLSKEEQEDFMRKNQWAFE